MDIVTHALMGAAIAYPFIESQPLIASSFLLGAVLPDIDSAHRVFGKRSFLHYHQGWTHSLFVAPFFGLALWVFLAYFGIYDIFPAIALTVGMIFHNLLDYTNTYGIMLFFPITKKRYCAEWVFFIDLVALFSTIICLILYIKKVNAFIPYLVFTGSYWFIKMWLRNRAGKLAPSGTVSLIPSGIIPWMYLGCRRVDDKVEQFDIHAITGRITSIEQHIILDQEYQDILSTLKEFTIMRKLSPMYHLISKEQQDDSSIALKCKDLRTRNFNTTFGDLELVVDSQKEIQKVKFHV